MKIIDTIKNLVRDNPEGLPVNGAAVIEGQDLSEQSDGVDSGLSLKFGFCSGGYVVSVMKTDALNSNVVAVEFDENDDSRISRPNIGVSGVWSGAVSFAPVKDEARAAQIASDVSAILKASLPKQAA